MAECKKCVHSEVCLYHQCYGMGVKNDVPNCEHFKNKDDFAEVRHGEWIIENSERDWKDKDTYRLFIKCSECGKSHFLGTTKYPNEYDKEKLKAIGNYADYSFCSKCGAKMDGKHNE